MGNNHIVTVDLIVIDPIDVSAGRKENVSLHVTVPSHYTLEERT